MFPGHASVGVIVFKLFPGHTSESLIMSLVRGRAQTHTQTHTSTSTSTSTHTSTSTSTGHAGVSVIMFVMFDFFMGSGMGCVASPLGANQSPQKRSLIPCFPSGC